mmetsp:Transcript_16042/g.16641  ORF Transcript_16042/g.16641 Transcript_16042/m.16641 type:complete len:239 (+) Transcript_16042:48-764(+)
MISDFKSYKQSMSDSYFEDTKETSTIEPIQPKSADRNSLTLEYKKSQGSKESILSKQSNQTYQTQISFTKMDSFSFQSSNTISSKDSLSTLSNIALVEAMTAIVDEIIDTEHPAQKSIFDNERIPRISIKDYLMRVVKYCKINKSTLIMSLVYIDRIPPTFIITMFNIHKIILACLLLASKINEDKIHTNLYFARVGGINLFEMNLIEIDTLGLIEYNLLVNVDTYQDYESHVLVSSS